MKGPAGAKPVHQIFSTMTWIRTSKFSIKNSPFLPSPGSEADLEGGAEEGEVLRRYTNYDFKYHLRLQQMYTTYCFNLNANIHHLRLQT